MSLMSSSILGDCLCQYILGCVVHFLNYNIPWEKEGQFLAGGWIPKGGFPK